MKTGTGGTRERNSCQVGHRTILVLLTLALLMPATGCYRNKKLYPASWPQISESTDIESLIEGSYACSGEIVHTQTGLWNKSSITGFLIGGGNPPSCERIEILKPKPDEIVIRFLAGGNEISRMTYTRDREYRVEYDWIVLEGFGKADKEYIVSAHETQTPRLTVDRQQNLIIKQTVTTIGTVLMVIPFGTAGTDWGKFKRLR